MVAIIRTYKMAIVLITVAAIIAILWFYANKDTDKSPNRGVFVLKSEERSKNDGEKNRPHRSFVPKVYI